MRHVCHLSSATSAETTNFKPILLSSSSRTHFPFHKKINENDKSKGKQDYLILHMPNRNNSQLGIFIPKHHVPRILQSEVRPFFKSADTGNPLDLKSQCYQIFSARDGFCYWCLQKWITEWLAQNEQTYYIRTCGGTDEGFQVGKFGRETLYILQGQLGFTYQEVF